MEEIEESSSCSDLTLFDLGDYNLYHIMSYLCLTDKLQLALIDNRFDECLSRFLRKDLFQMCDVVVRFRKERTCVIFQKYGHMIKRLCLKLMCYKDDDFHELASTYCKDLLELRCSCAREITTKVSTILIANSKTLETLEIFDWSHSREETPEKIVVEMSKLSNLTSLSLDASAITGKYLNNLTKLIYLDLQNCWDFEPEHFIEICKANKLKTLNIRGCRRLDSNAFQTLVETQTELHDISVGGEYVARNVESVADLEKLKSFRVEISPPQEVVRYIIRLAEVKNESLECLFAGHLIEGETYYGYDPLSEHLAKTITTSILQFRKLKELHLPTNSFLDASRMKRIAAGCPELVVFNIAGAYRIQKETIFQAVMELKHLNVLHIGGCIWPDFNFYDKLYAVVKLRNTVPLVVYGINCESLRLFLSSMEYKVRSQYLEVRTESMREFFMEIFRKRRIKKFSELHIKPTTYNPSMPLNVPSLLDIPEKVLKHLISYLSAVDKLKLMLTHNNFHELAAKSLGSEKINLNDFIRFFTFNQTRNILRICSEYVDKIYCVYEDGAKPVEYLNIFESYKTDFVLADVNSYPENYLENSFFPFDKPFSCQLDMFS